MSKSNHTHDNQGGSDFRVAGTSRSGDQVTENIQNWYICSCGAKHSYWSTTNTYPIKKK